MHQSESEISNQAGRPRVTVAALVERDGRFLFVEERDIQGDLVINQPAGHVESGETILEAVVRETYEETGWRVRPEALVGFYLWSRPDGAASYLRIAIAGCPERHDPGASLDEGIVRALWLSPDELAERRNMHRSPMVVRCVEDYLAGERYPLSVLKSLLA
jgi:8-oxo-dGTP pyrophosphatase MutT (NUDIX family)